MSAYLCNPEDFALLGAYAVKPGAPQGFFNLTEQEYLEVEVGDPVDVALMLAKENIKSLEYRSPNYGPAGGMLRGPLEEFLAEVELVAVKRYDYHDLVNVKKVLSRYEYQACEHADWLKSDAYNLVRAIKDQLLDELADRFDIMRAAQ